MKTKEVLKFSISLITLINAVIGVIVILLSGIFFGFRGIIEGLIFMVAMVAGGFIGILAVGVMNILYNLLRGK
jgi:uncharacterized Tic20 family protein